MDMKGALVNGAEETKFAFITRLNASVKNVLVVLSANILEIADTVVIVKLRHAENMKQLLEVI